MLKIDSRNLSFGATSIINERPVATMNASYNGNIEVYTSMNIMDVAAYQANKAAVDADFAAFCAEIAETVLATGLDPILPENASDY